jgi:tropomyosin
MASIRAEADKATLRAEAAEEKFKELEQLSLGKDHDLLSLNHKLELATQELNNAEAELEKYKKASLEGEQSKTTSEGLVRKVQLLEEELDAAEKNVKETVEKCAVYLAYLVYADHHSFWYRLRQVDVKAEHFERQLQRAEQERDAWEKKFEVCFVSYPRNRNHHHHHHHNDTQSIRIRKPNIANRRRSWKSWS